MQMYFISFPVFFLEALLTAYLPYLSSPPPRLKSLVLQLHCPCRGGPGVFSQSKAATTDLDIWDCRGCTIGKQASVWAHQDRCKKPWKETECAVEISIIPDLTGIGGY